MYLKQHGTPEEVFQTLQEEERDWQFRKGHHLETLRSPNLLRFWELQISRLPLQTACVRISGRKQQNSLCQSSPKDLNAADPGTNQPQGASGLLPPLHRRGRLAAGLAPYETEATQEGSGVGGAMVTKGEVPPGQLPSQVILWWAGISWVFSALAVNPGAVGPPCKSDTHGEHKFPERLGPNLE